ncbi:peptidylprolyl isomerase [Carnobacterium maltaromaticum]|uniref:peptidylprolyl isomerase n=1 Tax=Carnobacterium maltaromaticum TaxID=2751 RepID=UPI0039B03C31
MKKIIKLSVALFGGLILLGACQNKQDVLTIGEDSITKEALYEEMKQENGEMIVKRMAYEKILEKKYPVSDKEVEQKIKEYKNQGVEKYQKNSKNMKATTDSLKKNIRYQLLVEKAVAANYKVDENGLKAYYENWQPAIQVRHILLSNEASAKEVQEKLKNGESFKKMAEEYSLDVTTKSMGGLMESLTSGSVDSTFEAAAFALENKGDISEIIHSAFGYHLIELVKPSSKTTFEKDQEEVRATYIKANADEQDTLKILENEAKKVDLKVNDSFFKDSFIH